MLFCIHVEEPYDMHNLMLWFIFLELTAKEQTADKNKQYTKGTEYFRDRLGLEFKKIDGKFSSLQS